MDLKGKVIFVTGSTDGIGKHTARLLVRQGATVLLHGRYDPQQQPSAHLASMTACRSGLCLSMQRVFAQLLFVPSPPSTRAPTLENN